MYSAMNVVRIVKTEKKKRYGTLTEEMKNHVKI